MKAQSRLRDKWKWAGVVGCALILALWISSLMCPFGIGFGHHSIDLCGGGVDWIYCEVKPAEFWRDPGLAFHLEPRGPRTPSKCCGMYLPRRGVCGSGDLGIAEWDFYWTVPVWIPLLLGGLPTLWLWWRERLGPGGLCQRCGYDLTGNVSGTCPECGAAVAGRPADVAQR